VDLVSLFRLLGRRWWAAVPVAVFGSAGLVATVVLLPPTYVATASVVLLGPPTPPEVGVTQTAAPGDQNPYVQFGDLSVVVDVLRRIMESSTTEHLLEERGVTDDYTVAANVEIRRGPIIDVTTEGDTGRAALAANDLVVAHLLDELGSMQERQGTNAAYWITAEEVVVPDRGERSYSSTIRRVIAAGALVVVMVIASAVVADSVAGRVRRRRAV
jgi:uncharacterized protein involved in exopolysaccharide biosynthesis